MVLLNFITLKEIRSKDRLNLLMDIMKKSLLSLVKKNSNLASAAKRSNKNFEPYGSFRNLIFSKKLINSLNLRHQ